MSANDIQVLETLDHLPAEEGSDLYLSTVVCSCSKMQRLLQIPNRTGLPQRQRLGGKRMSSEVNELACVETSDTELARIRRKEKYKSFTKSVCLSRSLSRSIPSAFASVKAVPGLMKCQSFSYKTSVTSTMPTFSTNFLVVMP